MNSHNQESLEFAIVKSLETSSLKDLTTDLFEVGIDQFLEDGIIKDIPIIGSILRLRSSVGLVRDYIFIKKVSLFLYNLSGIHLEDRKRFLKNIENKNETKKLGETLIMLLDRLDDMTKPKLLAKIFSAYVNQIIDFSTFRKLSAVVDHLTVEAYTSLHQFYTPDQKGIRIGGEYLTQFASLGLAEIKFFSDKGFGAGGAFAQTELGQLYISIIKETT